VVKHIKWVAVILFMVVLGDPARAALDLFPQEQSQNRVEISPVMETVAVQRKGNRSYAKSKSSLEHPEGYRRLAFYMESAISRGDIRFDYEVPLSNVWLGVVQVHVNPNAARSKETGSFGILGGARLYLDGKYEGTFVQGLVGFNNNSSFALALELAAGYTIPWKDNLAIDLGVAMFRSGDATQPDSVFTVMVNLVVALDQPLFSFL